MKKTTFLNFFVFSLIMELGMILPTTIAAQSDGFFRGGETGNYETRDGGTTMSLGGATNENPTQAPLGSGLLIMVAAGAGYAVARRRRNYGHGATLILALALLLGMTQCKKKEILQTNTDDGVFITFNATYGGDRTVFDPGTYQFSWTKDVTEYIYVGGDKHNDCLGVLSGTATDDGVQTMSFSGTISPYNNEKLYFFYLGQGVEKTGYMRGEVDFSNQDGTLAGVTKCHLAVNDDEIVYTTGQTSFSATLNMKMAIAYFNVDGFKKGETPETVYIHGNDVYATATIDYKNGTITGGTKGYINIGTATSGKYVALVPSTTNPTDLKFESNNKTGSIRFNNGIQGAKFYSNNAIALNITANNPDGAALGLFSTAYETVAYSYKIATKIVRFSPGNLQYQASTGTWRFAENQWDYIGSDNTEISSSYIGWIDLFGWGTSGKNHGAICYQPWSISTNRADYQAYGIKEYNLYDQTGQADWGFNEISNGGNQSDRWRTLKQEEWTWLIGDMGGTDGVNRRAGNRFIRAEVTVMEPDVKCKGLVILPDGYTQAGISFNNYNAGYVSVDNAAWNNMRDAGAVFLPAAGYRNGTTYRMSFNAQHNYGYYWSSKSGSDNAASYIYFYHNTDASQDTGKQIFVDQTKYKYFGCSVRLVRDVN